MTELWGSSGGVRFASPLRTVAVGWGSCLQIDEMDLVARSGKPSIECQPGHHEEVM